MRHRLGLPGWIPLDPSVVPDQVGNANDSLVDLTPDPTYLAALRSAWAPLLHGQPIPRLGERTTSDERVV